MRLETKLDSVFSFVYRAKFDNGLTQHEFDHVLCGYYNDDLSINKLEVIDWKWVNLDFLTNDTITNSELYTIWFKIIFEKFYKNFNK